MRNAIQCKTALSMLFLLVLIGCNQSSDLTSPSASPRPTYTVDTSPIAKGVLVPSHNARLAFNISGLVQEVYVEIGDVVQVGDALVQLETVVLEANVARAESVLQIAQAEFENSKKQLDSLELQTAADARINIAEADLVITRYALKQATLTAPFDGTIVDVQVASGETVNSGRVIIILANLQTFQVETLDLEEVDIPRIYAGQPVEAYIEALDIKIDGSVAAIAPQATLLGEAKVFKVLINLHSQPSGLYWGMNADVKFALDE